MTTSTLGTTRTLGSTGPSTAPIGLGLMGMSDLYGPADDAESVATIHAALDAGVTLLDTGDFYGMGHNEMLLRDALRGRRRENALISVKFGALRDARGGWNGVDTRPAAVKNFLAYSLRRLGTDYIDIYRPARLDPAVPVEETMGALAELVQQGLIRHIGLSEVGADTLRRANAVHPVSDLQIEYSLDLTRHRAGHPADGPRTRHRHHRVRRAVPRPGVRPLARRRNREPARLPGPPAPLLRREPAAQPRTRRTAARHRGPQGRDRRPARHRLGPVPRRGHRPPRRRPPPRAAHRIAGSSRAGPLRRGPCGDRGRRPGRRRRGHALRRRPDGLLDSERR